MKVLEIKNNLVKIAYDAADNLALSGFVIIEDKNSPYVAQVMNIKADATSNYAIVKLLFTFDKDGILKNYNGTIPSLKANVSVLPSNELLDIIPKENPLVLGELAQQNFKLKIDKSILENNLLICSNNLENTTLFINNMISQADCTTVLFDTDGQFDWEPKITFGKDFKLPLNYNTINFIYENELEDVDPTSRAIIQDIFLEVQQYTKTLPEGFLPFETFLNVVDAQYKETQITQLVLLKNKLMKYKELNVFAENLKDIMNLSIEIEKNNSVVIDISNMPVVLQKEIMSYTYDTMKNINDKIYSFVKIDNNNSDKKLLKMFLEKTNIFTTIICPHEYKYLTELKETAQNLVLFAPLTLQHDFASYNTFLNKLNPDEFIVYGAHTQNIPLIVALSEIQLDEEDNEDETAEEEETQVETSQIPEVLPQKAPEENIEQTIIEEKEPVIETVAPIVEEPQQPAEEEIIETPLTQDAIQIEIQDELPDDIEIVDAQPIPNILEDDDIVEEPDTQLDPIIEENIIEESTMEEPIIDDNFDPYPQVDSYEQQNNDELIEQVSKDVDRAFYEKLPTEEEDELNFDELSIGDSLTEDDLNLIDSLAEENIELAGDELEPEAFEPIEEEQPPIVPIFEADDIEEKETPNFEPGDRVSTAKFGEGVVEKMLKYGNKMLCSIEFPNIGRRLLDPAMTEITKLS